jgi:hypothetical protein
LNNNQKDVGWRGIEIVSIVIVVLNLVKGTALVSIYAIRKFVDYHNDPPMRPRTGVSLSKVEMEAFAHV